VHSDRRRALRRSPNPTHPALSRHHSASGAAVPLTATAIGMAALRSRIKTLGAPAAPATLPDELSAREGQILRLVARGLSNRQIGAELYISEHTAASHVRSILRKTGCANRTDAASYAHRHSLVDADRNG